MEYRPNNRLNLWRTGSANPPQSVRHHEEPRTPATQLRCTAQTRASWHRSGDGRYANLPHMGSAENRDQQTHAIPNLNECRPMQYDRLAEMRPIPRPFPASDGCLAAD